MNGSPPGTAEFKIEKHSSEKNQNLESVNAGIWERELLSPQIEISLLAEKLSTPDKSDSSYVPYLLNF